MKRHGLTIFLLIGLLITTVSAAPNDYYSALNPDTTTPVITWRVVNAPGTAFSLYFSGHVKWHAENGSTLSFTITEIAEDVVGTVTLGNATWTGNDTDIAKDLTLGVWGLTPWLPGFIIKIGDANIETLNATAFAAAQRVKGNYLNGTMSSSFDTVVANGVTYNCIVFDYLQDPSYGTPQRTRLAYDLTSGVLVFANTSYSFGVPYSLVLEVTSIPGSQDLPLFVFIAGVSIVAIVVVIVVARKR